MCRQNFLGSVEQLVGFIIQTIFMELKGHTSLNRTKFNAWTRLRHEQIESNELIFIAKQTDVLARIGP